MAKLAYEIEEILNESVMTGVPSIIVEGIDDLEIYDKICSLVSFKTEIYPVECIDGYAEGCNQVIKAIKDLSSISTKKYPLKEHILGIVDKDVRDFRGEIPEFDAILILKYYSIESHFISKSIIEKTLKYCTRVTKDLITDDLCGFLMSEIDRKLADLYYSSLEALKKSLYPDYTSVVSYSYALGRLQNEFTKQRIDEKRSDLDCFAKSLNLNNNLDTLKMISKGKWLIELFAKELAITIDELPKLCKENLVIRCKYCVSEAHKKCLLSGVNYFYR